MSRENVGVVERAWRAYQGGDLSAALADIDKDFVAIRARPMPDVVPYYGREGMVQMLADWIDGFAEFQLTAEEFNDANERHVIVRIHQRAMGVKSGVPIEADFWVVHTMRDAKMLRMDICGNEAQALKAVGVAQ